MLTILFRIIITKMKKGTSIGKCHFGLQKKTRLFWFVKGSFCFENYIDKTWVTEISWDCLSKVQKYILIFCCAQEFFFELILHTAVLLYPVFYMKPWSCANFEINHIVQIVGGIVIFERVYCYHFFGGVS